MRQQNYNCSPLIKRDYGLYGYLYFVFKLLAKYNNNRHEKASLYHCIQKKVLFLIVLPFSGLKFPAISCRPPIDEFLTFDMFPTKKGWNFFPLHTNLYARQHKFFPKNF